MQKQLTHRGRVLAWRMRTTTYGRVLAAALCALALVASTAVGVPIQWAVEDGGNGHYYEFIDTPIDSWTLARSAAEQSTYLGIQGRLITIETEAENTFLDSISNGSHYIGGWQNPASPDYSEPSGGWEWITGEPFSYTNWWVNQPDNYLGAEAYIEFHWDGTWNDITDDWSTDWGYGIEYVVESSGCFVHITDLHYGYVGARQRIQQQLIPRILDNVPLPDFVLVTGDIVSWGHSTIIRSPAMCMLTDCDNNSYEAVTADFQTLEDAGIPVYYCPGNHDYAMWPWVPLPLLPDAYPAALGPRVFEDTANTRIVGVASGLDPLPLSHPPRGTGLEQDEFAWIINGITAAPSGSLKVVMMHHPTINYADYEWGCWPLWACGWDGATHVLHRPDLLDLCGEQGVDVVCSGHTHRGRVYRRSMDGEEPEGISLASGMWASSTDGAPGDRTLYVTTDAAMKGFYRVLEQVPGGIRVSEEQVTNDSTVVTTTWWGDVLLSAQVGEGCPAQLHYYGSSGQHVGRLAPCELDVGAGTEDVVYAFRPLVPTEDLDCMHWQMTEELVSLSADTPTCHFEVVGMSDGFVSLSIERALRAGGRLSLLYRDIQVVAGCAGRLYLTEG